MKYECSVRVKFNGFLLYLGHDESVVFFSGLHLSLGSIESFEDKSHTKVTLVIIESTGKKGVLRLLCD